MDMSQSVKLETITVTRKDATGSIVSTETVDVAEAVEELRRQRADEISDYESDGYSDGWHKVKGWGNDHNPPASMPSGYVSTITEATEAYDRGFEKGKADAAAGLCR